MLITLRKLFDLRPDQHDHAAIDESMRIGRRVSGTNLWVLIFAILIASVGLNVNSTAVVIGAMLISPLMGPLLAIGYGAAVSDYHLIRSAARSLLIFVSLSLLTSTLYFLISPLSQAQTELVARTSPTLWDVLIAFFGGCAGIIAQTRKSGSTIIPGAAIATALMPPLCTAGYGIASGNLHFLFGATYLFLINAFFITLATFFFVKLMRLPQHVGNDPKIDRRAHVLIFLGVLAMGVPSAYLAYGLVQDQLFLVASKDVGIALDQQLHTVVLRKEVDVKSRTMAVTVGGEPLAVDVRDLLEKRLQANGFRQAKLELRHVGNGPLDVARLREQLRAEVMANVDGELHERNTALQSLQLQLAKVDQDKADRERVIREALAEYPNIVQLAVTDGRRVARATDGAAETAGDITVLSIDADPPLSEADMTRIRAGLGVRFAGKTIEVLQAPPKVDEKAKAKATAKADPKSSARHSRNKNKK